MSFESARAALLRPDHTAVVVVDDASEIADWLERRIRSAGAADKRVLEAVKKHVDGKAARSDEERLVAWVAREVPVARLGDDHEVDAVRALRARVAGLGLRDAVLLVRKVSRA